VEVLGVGVGSGRTGAALQAATAAIDVIASAATVVRRRIERIFISISLSNGPFTL
jgi:hypothetical protein